MGERANARAISSKLTLTIDALTTEIAERRARMAKARQRETERQPRGRMTSGWFCAWSRHVGRIASAEGKLRHATLSLSAAELRAYEERRREERARSKAGRCEAMKASIARRLDQLRKDAPTIDAQWRADRAGEKKRLKRLKRAVAERVPNYPEPTRPLYDVTPIVHVVEADEFPLAPVERPDLVPGTFSLLNRVIEIETPPPADWTAEHVGERLLEARRVLRSEAGRVGPSGQKTVWPGFRRDEAGDLDETRRPKPTPAETSRMLEAIEWPMKYLFGRVEELAWLQHWMRRSHDMSDDKAPLQILETIARALRAADVAVR